MRALLLLAAIFAAGCGAPIQYGGPIPIDRAGLGKRLEALCRVSASSVCGSEEIALPEG